MTQLRKKKKNYTGDLLGEKKVCVYIHTHTQVYMNVCNYVYSLNFGDRLTLRIFCCCCCSVAKSCPTIRDPMDCSMPGFPVHHQLPEFAQTHAHWVSDALQPSHPLSSPSSPAFTLSQHQGLPMSQFFTSGGQSIGVLASASVLPVNIQGWFPLRLTG